MPTLHSLEQLAAHGLLTNPDHPALPAVAQRFAIAITPAMQTLIDPRKPDDPIARQFIPHPAELELRAEELRDPIGDNAHSPVKGIVHRYPDRVLLKLTEVCAVYCRFCFRRELIGPHSAQGLNDDELEAALDYIARTPDIWEVILTGGDPLVLSPRRLQAVIERLAAIPHLQIVRIHTRIPVVAPERVDSALLQALQSRLPVYLLLHCNHARELTPSARAACERLADAGIVLLSQSVLLRGVNDDYASLEALMRALVASRVKPHYLHHPDLAPGTGHFRLSPEQGIALLRELRQRLSGLCQPTYILEIPGGHGKVPLGSVHFGRDEQGAWIEGLDGQRYPYRDDGVPLP